MSRHHKPRRPYGQTPPSTPTVTPEPAHAANGSAPPGDTTADLVALRALIDQTRREVNERLDELAQAVERLLPAQPPAAPAAAPIPRPALPPIKVGDEVYVPRLGGTHTVVEVAPNGHTFKVQAGLMRVQVRRDESWALDDKATQRGAASKSPASRPHLSAEIPEIDLHGFSEHEALITLEMFLHDAIRQRTPRVRIIHGKGNGTLRAAVRRELARNPLVSKVETGPQFQGDDGVTLAELHV